MKNLVIADQTMNPIRQYCLSDRRKITVGRDPQRDLILKDPKVSRLHCVIYIENNDWCIADAGSSGGTRVDGKRIIWKRLKSGRVAEIGDLRLWIEGSSEDSQDLTGPSGTPGAAKIDLNAALAEVREDQDVYPRQPHSESTDTDDDLSDRTSSFLEEDGDFLTADQISP